MANSYFRQALLLAILALAFFLVVVALLFTTAKGQEISEFRPLSVWAKGRPEFVSPVVSGPRLVFRAEVSKCWRGDYRRDKRSRRYKRHGSRGSWVARYNRVEGLYLGVRVPRDERWRRYGANFLMWGEGGYGFSSKAWRYQVGLDRAFDVLGTRREPAFRFILGAEAHDLTDTQDEWIIPTDENSLAAFLLKEDFHDYYRRVGASGYLEQEVAGQVRFRAEYRDDRYYNMPPDPDVRRATNWALFGGKKEFRPNPLIDEGHLRGAVGILTVDTRDDPEEPEEGWFVQAVAEFYGGQVESDYEFDRFILDIRRYQPLGYGENLDLRLRLGSSRRNLPSQFLFDLGGISTLRGYRFKAFTGDRLFLANVEYRIRADSRTFGGIPIFGDMNLIFFFDAGLAWFSEDVSRAEKGWEYLTWSRLKTDVGVAITDRAGRVRLSFARRTDSANAPIVVTFRLNRAF